MPNSATSGAPNAWWNSPTSWASIPPLPFPKRVAMVACSKPRIASLLTTPVNSFVRRHHFFGDRWHPRHCWDYLSKTLVLRRCSDSPCDVVSIYPIDLQKLSPKTGSSRIEHYDEFSERRQGRLLTVRVPQSAKNTVPLCGKIYTRGRRKKREPG